MYECYVYDRKDKYGDWENFRLSYISNIDLSIYRISTMALRNKSLKKGITTRIIIIIVGL
jgi:hypothetical protein